MVFLFWANWIPTKLLLFFPEKETLDIWVNGKKVETESTFADEGTSMVFPLDGGDNSQEGAKACIRTISSGNKREGIVFCLIVDDQEIPETLEWNTGNLYSYTEMLLRNLTNKSMHRT